MTSLTCPVDLDSARLRREAREMYARVALAPDGSFHFHRGPAYAAERLGYDATELAARRVGRTGRAIGVDLTADMRQQARAGARGTGLTNVDVLEGDATHLP